MLHDSKVIPRYAPDAVIGNLKKYCACARVYCARTRYTMLRDGRGHKVCTVDARQLDGALLDLHWHSTVHCMLSVYYNPARFPAPKCFRCLVSVCRACAMVGVRYRAAS
ncbi:hypothetical protein PLICRDRAFT_231567 [Plicaturopsis crispa FD-325 SS-3]|nr:hypothetical protein PLICRDRAFT_231567 [Plicaturopsis crispa FD-325 SS-3]